MLASIVQIEIHLSGVGVGKLADLQVDDNQAAQSPMEEKQVDAIPFCADTEPPLARNEREIVAEFQKESSSSLISAFSRSDSEYSSFRFKNSSTNGSRIS